MHRICFYGSLKQGFYNRDRFNNHFGKSAIKHLKNTELKGFRMYDLGPYPACVKTGSESDTVQVELVEVSSECKEHIDMMEFGAGYYIEHVIIDDVPAIIYVFNGNYIKESYSIVENGNWQKND